MLNTNINNCFLNFFLEKNNIINNIFIGSCILVKILKISGNYLLVDGNLKSLSYIKKNEVLNNEYGQKLILNKFIKVLIIKSDNGRGIPIVSREKYFSRIFWKYIYASVINNNKVYGLLLNKIKGGFSILVNRFKCFLPYSETDKKILLNYNFYKNKKLIFNIVSFNYKKKNVILSRKTLINNFLINGKINLINKLKVGDLVKGIVKGFSNYGVYIDLGYLDGLILLKNILWGTKKYSNELFEINQGVLSRVLKIDKEKNRIYLGLKQIRKDPWSNIFKKYKTGYIKYGRVFKITNENIYIILEFGVFGFLKKIKMLKNSKDKIYVDKIKVNDYLKLIISYINLKKKFIGFKLYHKKNKNKNKFLKKNKINNKNNKINNKNNKINNKNIKINKKKIKKILIKSNRL